MEGRERVVRVRLCMEIETEVHTYLGVNLRFTFY